MTTNRAGRTLIWMAAALIILPARAQEPEVVVLDPNQPSAQNPRSMTGASGSAPQDTEAIVLPEVAATTPPSDSVREVLADLWFRYRALRGRGGSDEAGRRADAALEFMKREGLRAAPDIALAFLTEARSAFDEGDYLLANERYRLAARFDPSLTAAHFGLALGLLRGDRDLSGAVAKTWTGLRSGLTDPSSLQDKLGNVFLAIYLGVCLSGGLVLVLLGLRHAPAFFHDLRERSSRGLTDRSARLVGWWVLALPVIVLLPLVWILATWASLFANYLHRSERIIALSALLLLAGAGPSALFLDWAFGMAADPAARALIRSARGGYESQEEEVLRRLVNDRPQEAIFPFLLAGLHKDGGRYDEAMQMYRRALEINPTDARLMVDLGNLHALRQEFALAQNLYRKASEADPALALAHYNSHLAHLEAFHLEAADQELKQARVLDDALVTELLARGDEGRTRRVPVDIRPSGLEVWKRAARLRLGQSGRVEWSRAFAAPATLAGGAGLIAALALPGLGLVPRSSSARRCRRCGGAYCRRCQVATKYPDHCSQCMHLFILRDGLAPSIKSRKLEDVASHRRRTWVAARMLSLVLPGGGHVMGGRPLLGGLLLSTWTCSWVGFLLQGRLLVAPEDIVPAVGPGPVLLLAILGLGAWVVANLSSHDSGGE